MPNERNVEALRKKIRDIMASHAMFGESPDKMAELLARDGVLVPEAVQWTEAVEVIKQAGLFDIANGGAEFTIRFRGALERIARG